jgi:hypothetical protein
MFCFSGFLFDKKTTGMISHQHSACTNPRELLAQFPNHALHLEVIVPVDTLGKVRGEERYGISLLVRGVDRPNTCEERVVFRLYRVNLLLPLGSHRLGGVEDVEDEALKVVHCATRFHDSFYNMFIRHFIFQFFYEE